MSTLFLLFVSWSRQNSVNEPAPEFSEAINQNETPSPEPGDNVNPDVSERRRRKRKQKSEPDTDLDNESPDVKSKRLKLTEAYAERLRNECSPETLENMSQEDLEEVMGPSLEQDMTSDSEEETDGLGADLNQLTLTHNALGSPRQEIWPHDDFPIGDDPVPEHVTLLRLINSRLIRFGDWRFINTESNFMMTLIDDYRSLAARTDPPDDKRTYEILVTDILKYLRMNNDHIFQNV